MMCDVCGDNRFELIGKYKKALMEATNIEHAKDEMAVIDDILFRFWQMGWLDKLEAPVREVVLCKDCVFGHQYFDVINGELDSWVECRNPDGLNRDVSMDGFCSASIRRQENEEMQEVANLDAFYGEALND